MFSIMRCQLVAVFAGFLLLDVGLDFRIFGVRLWFGSMVRRWRLNSARPRLVWIEQKAIVLGFHVLAVSRLMEPGQCEHGAVVTPAGFRELSRGIDRL